ncbi:MAG: hypothetical protein AEth_00303 [Candidatus Argoarchaeum ethanivorans]|uniref:Uncharacterized protein n=1 Tax=Candidatus Argoarchaeum ethanivorans TaxID=2608793 RepID=A0A8B3S490_9EURY|nr:MAG: hypothetical protein AEth_00303 [Candidatus Argoarchaeum ethanivorans]
MACTESPDAAQEMDTYNSLTEEMRKEVFCSETINKESIRLILKAKNPNLWLRRMVHTDDRHRIQRTDKTMFSICTKNWWYRPEVLLSVLTRNQSNFEIKHFHPYGASESL